VCVSLAVIFAGPTAADEARVTEGWAGKTYFEARVGFPFPEILPMKITNTAGAAASGTQKIRFGSSVFTGLMIGHYLTERFRIEWEVSYGTAHDADVRFASGFAGNPLAGTRQSGGGYARSLGTMFNMLYDFPIEDSRLRPFVGVGAGVTRITVSSFGPHASPYRITDSALGYTGCLLAGFNYAITKRTELTLRYTGVIRSKTTFADTVAGQRVRAVSPSGFGQGLSFGFRIRLN